MASAASFIAHVESGRGAARIALSGELDIATVPVLEDHLAHVETDGVAAITLDLRELTFIDTMGLRAFIAARERAKANGRRLILAGAGQPVRRLIELTGTEFLLDDQDAVDMLDA